MLGTNLVLGLLIFSIVFPWMDAATVNGTVESVPSKERVDSTQEDLKAFSLDLNTEPTIDKKNEENVSKHSIARLFELPREELTGFETEVPCDNAQFLVKILTVILPLLRDEVPASTRTSYILYVLKSLLKSSPEAARDYEIMYKINDLLLTLEKNHDKEFEREYSNHNALRQLDTKAPNSNGVRSKVVFKYEVPQLINPDCTAELLTIVKIVQETILRLVNNPLCKTNVPVELPILMDVKEYLENPSSYDKKLQIDSLFIDKSNFPPEDVLDIDIPGKVLDKKPLYPYVYEDVDIKNDGNYHDKLPFQQKQNLYPLLSKPFYIYPKYIKDKNIVQVPYPYDVSPDILSIINHGTDRPEYITLRPKPPNALPNMIDQIDSLSPSVVDIKLPNIEQDIFVETPISQIDVTDDKPNILYKNPYDYLTKDDILSKPINKPRKRPSELEIFPSLDLDTIIKQSMKKKTHHDDNPRSDILPVDIDKTKSLYEFDFPLNQNEIEKYQPNSINEHNLRYSTRRPQPLGVYGDYDSAEIQIGPYKSNMPIHKKPKPSQFVVDGLPNSLYTPLAPGQSKKNPYKFDTSPYNLPTERGIPVFSKDYPKPSFNPYLPTNSPNRSPNKPDPKNPFFPVSEYELPTKELAPFNLVVSGEGSGEIQLGRTETPALNDVELYVPKKPKTNVNDYYQSRYSPDDKEHFKPSPEYYWSRERKDGDLDNVGLEIPIDFYAPNKKNILISETITNRPSQLEVENQYALPEITMPYEEIPIPNNLSPDFDISVSAVPKLWNTYNTPSQKILQPHHISDNKILLIIKDNIDVMEELIPKEHLNAEIRELIINLKHLLNIKQITIEEYVNIINKYQVLIENVKRLSISNAIMKELLLSITNLNKLDMLPGKSQVIELTYLIKRPEPLVYQPYYYIKYQLPYDSFLTRVERLLTTKPYLKTNPAKLYKALISISKVAETSPDLEQYGKEDIFKLTFNKGTLVGAKLIKGTDIELYTTLERFKKINSDITVDDVYELIRNLDSQLKHSSEGLVLENSNIHTLNIYEQPDKIRVTKVNEQPIIKKITKITTNEVAADKILADILQKANVLRSNISASYTEKGSDIALNNNTDVTNDSISLIGRTKDVYDLNQLSNTFPLSYQPIDYDIKPNTNKHSSDDYLNIYKNNLNYYAGNNPEKPHKIKNKITDVAFNLNELYSNPSQYVEPNQLLGNAEWWKEAKSNPYKSKSFDSAGPLESPKVSPYSTDYSTMINSKIPPNKQLYPIKTSKLLENPVNPDKDYKNFISQQYYFNSPPTSISNDKIIGNPDSDNHHLIRHSKTYVNGIPVTHSKSYRIDKPDNEDQFKTSNTDIGKSNVKKSQSFINSNSYVDNYNKPIPSQEVHLDKQHQANNIDLAKHISVNDAKTPANDNSYSDLNKFNNKLSQSQDANSLQKPEGYRQNMQQNIANVNTFTQKQALMYADPYIDTQQNMANNINYYGNLNGLVQNQAYFENNPFAGIRNVNLAGNFGLFNRNVFANQMNNGYRYWMHQRWPYRINRMPRLITRPFLG